MKTRRKLCAAVWQGNAGVRGRWPAWKMQQEDDMMRGSWIREVLDDRPLWAVFSNGYVTGPAFYPRRFDLIVLTEYARAQKPRLPRSPCQNARATRRELSSYARVCASLGMC